MSAKRNARWHVSNIKSPKRELGEYLDSGRLRDDVESSLSTDAADLLEFLVRRHVKIWRRAWRLRGDEATSEGR